MGLTWYNGFSPKLRDESWRWLKAEVASGRVEPPSKCQACGKTEGHLDHHTEDYSKPFGPHIYAYQLCFRCHMTLHARHRLGDWWLSYIEHLEAGAIYKTLWNRKQIVELRDPRWISCPEGFRRARPRLDFFRGLKVSRRIIEPVHLDQPTFGF